MFVAAVQEADTRARAESRAEPVHRESLVQAVVHNIGQASGARMRPSPLRQPETTESILMQTPPDDVTDTLCFACVFYPPNLPSQAYSEADWLMLQARTCAFDYIPGTTDCLANRKTSCSLVDLASTRPAS